MLAMWSRPTRMAAAKTSRREAPSSRAASSKAAEAWVMVTSLSTPSEPMMNPASSNPVIETCWM
ncbi:Uncharacterised protein [Mycobacteroides abscessus subsp. abscessus]|nr:Uncharacterised protein [Mycobacteroides abscessus subsp. abscessus]